MTGVWKKGLWVAVAQFFSRNPQLNSGLKFPSARRSRLTASSSMIRQLSPRTLPFLSFQSETDQILAGNMAQSPHFTRCRNDSVSLNSFLPMISIQDSTVHRAGLCRTSDDDRSISPHPPWHQYFLPL